MQARIIISGIVQGVFCRDFIRKNAEALNIKGYVRNTKEGNVEVLAGGKKEDIKKLVEQCKTGPLEAKIKNIEIEEIKSKEKFSNFIIRDDKEEIENS